VSTTQNKCTDWEPCGYPGFSVGGARGGGGVAKRAWGSADRGMETKGKFEER